MHVVALGNSFDGIDLYGPFQTANKALSWAKENADGKRYMVVNLNEVEAAKVAVAA